MGELEEEVRRYRDMVESSLGLICTHDLEGVILTANAAAADLLGWEPADLVGRNIRDLLAPPVQHEFDDYLDRLEEEGEASGVMQVVARDGSPRFLKYRNVRREIAGRPPHVLGHSQDVTEQIEAQQALRSAREDLERTVEERSRRLTEEIAGREQMEDALRKSQRMESVGLLAGGVAHDFNNLLTAVQGYAALIREIPDLPPRAARAIGEIERAGERAASLTRQLLAFSRQQVMHPKTIAVNQVIRGVETLLETSLRRNIELRIDLDPEAGTVRVDPGQLEQVLVKLALNAREAMPTGGELSIRTRRLEQASCRDDRPELEPGSYALVSVSDTGQGMDEETRRRAFEPFYTTRKLGEASGLGLAMVYGIVKQSRGWIYLESAPGEGATFDIYLPRVEVVAAADEAPAPVHGLMGGEETILLVEDDSLVASLVSTVLEGLGYEVLLAASGSDALKMVGDGEEVALLLTDVVLPGMSGPEVAERVRERLPGVRTLFVSGYASEEVQRRGVLAVEGDFLRKPFTPRELADRVRQILDR